MTSIGQRFDYCPRLALILAAWTMVVAGGGAVAEDGEK